MSKQETRNINTLMPETVFYCLPLGYHHRTTRVIAECTAYGHGQDTLLIWFSNPKFPNQYRV